MKLKWWLLVILLGSLLVWGMWRATRLTHAVAPPSGFPPYYTTVILEKDGGVVGGGSGFIVNAEAGIIVTAAHVTTGEKYFRTPGYGYSIYIGGQRYTARELRHPAGFGVCEVGFLQLDGEALLRHKFSEAPLGGRLDGNEQYFLFGGSIRKGNGRGILQTYYTMSPGKDYAWQRIRLLFAKQDVRITQTDFFRRYQAQQQAKAPFNPSDFIVLCIKLVLFYRKETTFTYGPVPGSGYSGGPIATSDGKVVGMVVITDGLRVLAVPWWEIEEQARKARECLINGCD